LRALWNSAPFGIQRPLEFSALWNSAPFGISRLLEFGAVVALRRFAFRAVSSDNLSSSEGEVYPKKEQMSADARTELVG
jgi:hypothetical protein